METRMGGGHCAGTACAMTTRSATRPSPIWRPMSASSPRSSFERKERDRLHDSGLRDALAGLDERSRTIVQRRWLVEDGEEAATLHELAAEYGVSAERIRQIEAKAMQKMKGALAPQM